MTTGVGDIVLVHVNESPAFFARVEAIEPDAKRDWWQVGLLILQVPAKEIVWILREAYLQGETFTIDGTPIFLKKIAPPKGLGEAGDSKSSPNNGDTAGKGGARVISLSDRKKK